MATRAPTTRGALDYAREERMRQRAREEDSGRPLAERAEEVPERGVRLNLCDFPYQREWYSDELASAREVVWMKAAQVGMSAYAWRWAARRADQFGDSVIYFFPTDVHVREFGDMRIEPSITGSPYLLRKIPRDHVRQKSLKQIGSGFLSLRGMQSEAAVQSVDADSLVFDEYDLSDPRNLEQAERRISGALAAGRTPRLRRLGYPSVPGFGIHARFAVSDQRVWLVRCAGCGEETELSWEGLRWRNAGDDEVRRAGHDEWDDPEAIEAVALLPVLRRVPEGEGGPLWAGRWAPRNPGARTIGDYVPRLLVPRTDLRQIVVNSRSGSATAVEAFFTLDLGLPFSSSESALTDADLLRASAEGLEEAPGSYRGRRTVTAGLDVASERALTLRISEHLMNGTRRALYLGEPGDFQEAAELLKAYAVRLCVVDSLPERRQARALAATLPGRVVLCSYNETDPQAQAFRYDAKKNLVTVNRTEAIDAMMDAVRQGRNVPLRNPPRGYVEQMKSPKRRTVEDSKGRPRRVYVTTGTAGDDYAHAEVYDVVATELHALMQRVDEAVVGAAGTPLADEVRGFRRADAYDPGLSEFER